MNTSHIKGIGRTRISSVLAAIAFSLAAVAVLLSATYVMRDTVGEGSATAEAKSTKKRCTHTDWFTITKNGYTYSGSATSVYYRTGACTWPSWGTNHILSEVNAYINPGLLSYTWYPGCGNTHSYSAWIVATPPAPPSCGSANGSTVSSAPTSGLCASGTASAVTDNGGTYSWTCHNAAGATASCITTKTDCPAGQKKCNGQCVAEGASCGGGGCSGDSCGEEEEEEDICPAGQALCAGQCVREEEQCYEDDLLAKFCLVPDIVREGTNERCIAEWVAQDIDGDPATVVTCTINGDQAPQFTQVGAGVDLAPGTYTLSCTDGLTSQSTTTRCRAIPNFEEF
jgi:hypothetical protein